VSGVVHQQAHSQRLGDECLGPEVGVWVVAGRVARTRALASALAPGGKLVGSDSSSLRCVSGGLALSGWEPRKQD